MVSKFSLGGDKRLCTTQLDVSYLAKHVASGLVSLDVSWQDYISMEWYYWLR